MSIYQEFKPTYLYIKQHTVTGKLYFGKTIQDPEKYHGSGVRWKRHIKKHGKKFVVTLWYELFDNIDEIQKFALSFSKALNIVESDQWANLKFENGLDGAPIGNVISLITRIKIKNSLTGRLGSNKGRIHSEESKEKNRQSHLGKIISKETRIKLSNAGRGRIVSIETCDKISKALQGIPKSEDIEII